MPDYKLIIEYSSRKPIYRSDHFKMQSGDLGKEPLKLLKKYIVGFVRLKGLIPIENTISQNKSK